MRRFAFIGLAFGTMALAACQQSVSSTSTLTSGVSADIAIVGHGNGNTDVNAKLKVGDINAAVNLDLQGSDQLVASEGNGAPQVMAKNTVAGFVNYNVQFHGGTVDAPGTAYKVALNRTIDNGAPNSTCTLPSALAVNPPTAGAFSRANDDIVITWAPGQPGEQMHYTYNGDCVFAGQDFAITSDVGTLTISKGSIQPTNSQMPGSCQLTITLDRVVSGTIDPGYGKGGRIVCKQERTVAVTTNP
jgi:hypothetical protein